MGHGFIYRFDRSKEDEIQSQRTDKGADCFFFNPEFKKSAAINALNPIPESSIIYAYVSLRVCVFVFWAMIIDFILVDDKSGWKTKCNGRRRVQHRGVMLGGLSLASPSTISQSI